MNGQTSHSRQYGPQEHTDSPNGQTRPIFVRFAVQTKSLSIRTSAFFCGCLHTLMEKSDGHGLEISNQLLVLYSIIGRNQEVNEK